jgi:hypothetical protein
VGSFEDAFCATILNPDFAAVVVHEGFAFQSRHDAPILRTITADLDQHQGSSASALHLAQVLKRVRPELDLYLVVNGRVEDIAAVRVQLPHAASSMPSRSCWNCTLRSSKACKRDMRRRSSTI